MEALKEVNEKNIEKRSKFKENVRVVSPNYKINRKLRRSQKNSCDLENRISPASSRESDKTNINSDDGVPPLIQNLKNEIVRRAYTMPNLFSDCDLKTIHGETNLRQKLTIRNHASPFTDHQRDPRNGWKEIHKKLRMSQNDENVNSKGITDKEEKVILEYLRKKQSISGLWNMASSTAYEIMARKSNNIDDIAMAVVSKQIAVKKMRQKIAKKLELPEDRFKRIALLRQNVSFIEQKFENLKHIRPKKTAELDINLFQECDTSDLPSRFTKPGEAKTYFRKFGRMVLIVLNWIFIIMDKNETTKLERELKSFVDIAQEAVDKTPSSQSMEEQGLSFDKHVYKANKEISLTHEHRKILTTRPNFRTPEMIKQVMHGLHALRSLADYPLRTQERLCQVAWFQTIGPKKVIIRQGHNAESFYFILSGTAYVKKVVQNETTGEAKVQVAARLTRGQSFGFSWEDGEIGLIFNTKRTATVESTTAMDLLVIGKEDFHSIFMKAEDHNEEAEHVKFLREVPILSQWPVECLLQEPGTCVLHYFKRGNLITANGKESEWLYVVKSGTCEAMKELKATKARKSGQSYIRPDPISDIILPELGNSASPRVNTGIAHRRKFVMTPEIFEEMSRYYDKLKQSLKELKKDGKELVQDYNRQYQNEKKITEKPVLPKLLLNSQLTCIKDDSSEELTDVDSVKSCSVLIVPPVKSMKPELSKGISNSSFNERTISMLKMKAHFMFPTASMIEKESPSKKESPAQSEQTQKKTSVFVHVHLLQAKDVFGLNTLSGWGSDDIEDTVKEAPPLCLVSRGAEIVMLSKRIFLKYMNDKVRATLREKLRPYPSECKLQDTFQTKLDWDNYKNSLLEDILKQQCNLKAATGLV